MHYASIKARSGSIVIICYYSWAIIHCVGNRSGPKYSDRYRGVVDLWREGGG